MNLLVESRRNKPKSSTSEKKLEFSYRRNLDGLITISLLGWPPYNTPMPQLIKKYLKSRYRDPVPRKSTATFTVATTVS
jgi:hypothetical protein